MKIAQQSPERFFGTQILISNTLQHTKLQTRTERYHCLQLDTECALIDAGRLPELSVPDIARGERIEHERRAVLRDASVDLDGQLRVVDGDQVDDVSRVFGVVGVLEVDGVLDGDESGTWCGGALDSKVQAAPDILEAPVVFKGLVSDPRLVVSAVQAFSPQSDGSFVGRREIDDGPGGDDAVENIESSYSNRHFE